jgi:thermostable 8-oxoguanine DNA glycosylase
VIDPFDLTRYDRSDAELEEFALFCPLTAATSAKAAAGTLEKMLCQLRYEVTPFTSSLKYSPFELVRQRLLNRCGAYGLNGLIELLRFSGARAYRMKASAVASLARAGLDLRTCSVSDLDALSGIGRKTASFFVLHSRPGVRVAVLDRHILRELRALFPGERVPESAPQSHKEYDRLERLYLGHVGATGQDPARLDLAVWSRRASRSKTVST